MKKIPVKIVQYTINGETRKNVMIDMLDTYDIEGDAERKIINFKKKYFELIKKAEKLFFGSNLDKTRSTNLLSSTYWKLGSLFQKFDDDIKNNFIITNYAESLERDFGRSSSYIRELIEFSKLFKKNEISDIIPMAVYRALVWKKNQLDEIGILEKEKNRLIEMGKNKKHPGREKYKIELINAIKDEQSKNKINNKYDH